MIVWPPRTTVFQLQWRFWSFCPIQDRVGTECLESTKWKERVKNEVVWTCLIEVVFGILGYFPSHSQLYSSSFFNFLMCCLFGNWCWTIVCGLQHMMQIVFLDSFEYFPYSSHIVGGGFSCCSTDEHVEKATVCLNWKSRPSAVLVPQFLDCC